MARRAIQGKALATPLISLNKKIHGREVYLKAESLQPGGSFKIRGALYSLSKTTPEQRKNGVVAYSTGNHAQAVAIAANLYNTSATIVMSTDAMPFKIEATRQLGAEVVLTTTQERKAVAEQLAASRNAIYIPPYDHIDIITGQGTIGLEILEAMTPSVVFVPVGGGGLIAGIASAIKQKDKSVTIIGVEPIEKNSGTIADAVNIPSLGALTEPLIQKYVDDMIRVKESEIASATISSIESSHLFLEPSGALALAGALIYPFAKIKAVGPIVCIASGGNTTMETLSSF